MILIKADINSAKASIFDTNVHNKVPISESHRKNVTLPISLKFLCPLTVKL